MRLKRVEQGHELGARLKLGLMGLVTGRRAPDVLRTLFYRPEFFGNPFRALMQPAMRGDSRWSAGERELFAAFTSRLNQCPF